MPANGQTPGSLIAITLRTVGVDDYQLLRDLYASTRGEEMALVPWTDEQQAAFIEMQFQAQQGHYKKFFPQATHEIVLDNGRAVGALYVQRLEREIRIIDLILLPKERNAGIGRHLMQTILDEAGRLRKAVGIYVESFNPSGQFFRRLGFVETERSGIHIHMQWFPSGSEHKSDDGNAKRTPPQ